MLSNSSYRVQLTRWEQSQLSRLNASSPLLRLPREIKDTIYEYVFVSNRLVHVRTSPGYPIIGNGTRPTTVLRHSRCLERFSETEYQESFDHATAQWHDSKMIYRHGYHCTDPRSWDPPALHLARYNPYKIDLTIFYICRRIYYEAKTVVYKTTGFSFNSRETLLQFIKRVPASQLASIRRLRLEIPEDANFNSIYWHNTLTWASTAFIGLQYLHLDIFPGYMGGKDLEQGLVCFADMPLKVVTVVGSEDPYGLYCPYTGSPPVYAGAPDQTVGRWDLVQRQEWSRWLRRRLMRGEEDASVDGVRRFDV